MSGSLKLRNKGSVSTINNDDYFYLAKQNEVQGDGKTTIGDLKDAFGISNVPGYKLVGRKIFTSSGTWNKDPGVDAVFVQVQGGGGGGAAASSNLRSAGGGAGGYSEKFVTSGLASSESVVIGTGGIGGSGGGDGVAGTSTSFGSHLSATGGNGGSTNGTGGAGGVGSSGDRNVRGNPGGGVITSSGLNGAGGNGGASVFGGAGQGVIGAGGSAYANTGSGGAGGNNNTNGGAGSDGIVIIWEYTSGQEIAAPIVTGITGYKKIGTKVFTTSGTWVKSLGTDAINVKLVAGGGGGGGSPLNYTGGGGGAGGYAESFITSGFASSETVIVGAGGSGGLGSGLNNGSNGGSSSFGSHLSAVGGIGGSAGGGYGGPGNSGTVNNGIGWTAVGQAGGSVGCFVAGNGDSGPNGGSSLLGGGGRGGSNGVGHGTVGSNGGGGGGSFGSGTAINGGNGGAGIVIIEEYALDTSGDNSLMTSPSFAANLSGSAQSVSSNTLTKVTLNSETLDTNNWFDTSVNYRSTPQFPGIYVYNGSAEFTAMTTGGYLAIFKNGAEVQRKSVPSGGTSADVFAVLEMNGTTDFVELYIFSASNSITVDQTNKKTNLQSTFTGRKDTTIGYLNRKIILSNNSVDSNNDVDFSKGFFQFSDYTGRAEISSPLTKQLDANWNSGNNAGMLDTGSKLPNTWYHCFGIYNLVTQESDILASSSLTPLLPNGYTKYKRVGSILTDGSGNIKQFFQYNNEFEWKTPVLDINTVMGTTSGSLYTINTPNGVSTKAIMNCFMTGGGGEDIIITNPAIDNLAPSKTAAPLAGNLVNPGGGSNGPFKVTTNTSSQIRIRTTATGTTLRVSVLGWNDYQLDL